MPLTITDADSAYLEAYAEQQEWEAEFMAEFYKPQNDLMLYMLWARLSPEVHANLKRMAPAGYAAVEQQIHEIERRKENGILGSVHGRG
jgi:hypothetical protein